MGRILQRAEDSRKPLTFVMVHAAPHARVAREAGLQRFVREEVRLEGGRHYYLEGNFYQRAQPRAYVPPFPSVVLFFSTTEGSKRWPVTRSLVDDIKRAFAWPRVKSKPERPSAMLPVPSRPAAPPPAIGRKRAVDADDTDDDDPPPASRPVKKEKKNGYAVDGFVVDTDEEEALAAEQPAKRRKGTPPWDWATAPL
jgi:hypothetical protein